MSGNKYVIFNADDFGYSAGINRGIVEAHERGVVTSATMIVNAAASVEAAQLARTHPKLAVGLHVNLTNEAQRLVDLEDPDECRDALRQQYERFQELLGRKPTHLDSHQHVHRHPMRQYLFQELADEAGIPLRDRPPVVFKGGFYGQWEYGVSDPEKISFAALERILKNEIRKGVYEMSCHPGYVDPTLELVYNADRERELATLVDPNLPGLLAQEGIHLISYGDLPEVVKALRAH